MMVMIFLNKAKNPGQLVNLGKLPYLFEYKPGLIVEVCHFFVVLLLSKLTK